ncbi:MAG TPA: hypothetical protein VJJ82_01695 [Candidatus Nanoarchaeia archaeon]|nr:hypothetical protein [Candidatus Nanoarchaeia archaeon]
MIETPFYRRPQLYYGLVKAGVGIAAFSEDLSRQLSPSIFVGLGLLYSGIAELCLAASATQLLRGNLPLELEIAQELSGGKRQE